MRARITGRATLPAVVAASVVAVAAPAVAQAAVPAATDRAPVAVPVDKNEDCEQGLELLKQIKLLPGQPDLAKTLCTIDTDESSSASSSSEEEPGKPRGLQMPRDYTPPAAGRPTEQNTRTHDLADHQDKLLGLPMDWPEGLTVWIPTLQQGKWHSYGNSAGDGAAEDGAAKDPAAAPIR